MNTEKTVLSIAEAAQDFSKVTELVNLYGKAVILKNNLPKYVVTEADKSVFADDETVNRLSKEFIKKNKRIYEELAK